MIDKLPAHQKKYVKIILVVICVLWAMPILYCMRNAIKTREFMLPFETLAIEYVQEQTDVIQKFGTDMEIECVHRVLTLYDGYDKHIFYDDYEKVVEILEIHLMVNDKDTCIVVFESNDEKRLVIDHYYWK